MTGRKRLPAAGREALASLFAIGSVMDCFAGQFEQICRRTPNGWRDFRMVQARINTLLDGILDTIPLEQLKTIKEQLALTSIHVAVKRASGKPNDNWVISYDDLADLAEYATKTQCMACDQMHKPCRLREILKELPVEGVEKLVVGCLDG